MGLLSRLTAPINRAAASARSTGSGPSMGASSDSGWWDAELAASAARGKERALSAPKRREQDYRDRQQDSAENIRKQKPLQDVAEGKALSQQNDEQIRQNKLANPRSPFGADPDPWRT